MAQASAEKTFFLGLPKKLEQTGPAEKERVASVPQREQLAGTPEPPLPKGKGTEPFIQSPDHEGEDSQGGRELHLGKGKGD